MDLGERGSTDDPAPDERPTPGRATVGVKMNVESHRVRYECDGVVIVQGRTPLPLAQRGVQGLVFEGVHYDVLSYELVTDDRGPIYVGHVRPTADMSRWPIDAPSRED